MKHHSTSIHTNARRSCAVLAAIISSAALVQNAMADNLSLFEKKISGVPAAQPRVVGDNILSPEFGASLVAQGIELLENPSGLITQFGYLSDGTRTDPAGKVYLVLDHNPGGPTPGYDYGRHFLYSGHENRDDRAYITRINLDVASPDHRITLLTPVGSNGLTGLNSIDSAVWNPFSRTLLFTQDSFTGRGVIEVSADFDPATGAGKGLRSLNGSMGRASYEGIVPDDKGNILIVEDFFGADVVNFAQNPSGFVYRFVPYNVADLTKGKLQVMQVIINGNPVKFVPVDPSNPNGGTRTNDQLLLHTIGSSWPMKWITIHDTAVHGTAPFDAHPLAVAAGGTPFNHSEEVRYEPLSKFQTFFFTCTGNVDAQAGSQPALAARGSWGAIFRVDLDSSRNTGKIAIAVLGDPDHASFGSLTFGDKKFTLLVSEDRGELLHTQLNKLDSVWAYELRKDDPRKNAVVRLMALGQERNSPFETAPDNEPVGIHMSEGDPSIKGLLGTGHLQKKDVMLFFTQQHGQNNVFEIFPR